MELNEANICWLRWTIANGATQKRIKKNNNMRRSRYPQSYKQKQQKNHTCNSQHQCVFRLNAGECAGTSLLPSMWCICVVLVIISAWLRLMCAASNELHAALCSHDTSTRTMCCRRKYYTTLHTSIAIYACALVVLLYARCGLWLMLVCNDVRVYWVVHKSSA